MSEEKQQWRSFYPHLNNAVTGGSIEIEGPEHHFISRVLRLRPGQLLELFDGSGKVATCQIDSIEKRSASLTINSIHNIQKPSAETHLFLATPKQSTLEESLNLAFQLGFTHTHIFKSDKTHHKGHLKQDKLEKIAVECLRVTREAWLPSVKCYENLNQVRSYFNEVETLLFCDESPVYENGEKQKNLLQAMSDIDPKTQKIGLLIGPEASFSPKEREVIKTIPHQAVLLGHRILKVPAAVAAGGSILGMWRDSKQ